MMPTSWPSCAGHASRDSFAGSKVVTSIAPLTVIPMTHDSCQHLYQCLADDTSSHQIWVGETNGISGYLDDCSGEVGFDGSIA